MSKAKLRNPNKMHSKNGCTRRVYMPNSIYDKLLQEAEMGDISFSQLIRQKLEDYDKIRLLIK